ncbi:protein rep, partial [Endozoicomonas sp.]|uniref:protein rep n=1 Tax=Endozoicomonas sp. TaxID=1892382 RepID=UPI00383AB9F2
CPVCAAVVQERRRAEIAQGIDWAYGNDKKVVMVTITFSHTRFQSLADLLSKQSRALRKLRGGREWTDFKDSVGFGGLIRTLELTYGKSGWHPHTHELWIVDKDVDPEYIRHTVTERWLKICRKEGLVTRGKTEAFRKHSIDVKDNCSTSDYMAKQDDSSHWGADREIANGSVKGAYGKGKHPFQLLDEYSLGNEYSGKLFLDYLEAMRGKAQIFWSHGLKDRVGLDEKTDVELAEEKQDAADLLTSIKRNEWKLVLKYNARTLVLDAAELYGLPGIHILLNDLYCKEIDVQDSS